MVHLVAAGAVGALVWTGWRAFRREMDRLEQEDASRIAKESGTLERDPDTGRYRLK